MVAEGHRVVADHVHDLGAVLTHPLNVKERSGETVTAVQQQTVGDFIANLAYDGGLPGRAAIAIPVGFVLGMHVIGVHDGEFEAFVLGR